MKYAGVFLAAAVVLITDAISLFQVYRNRSGGPLAAIELTESELHLDRPQRESTAYSLRIVWERMFRDFKFEDGPGWFGRAKLEEIGYDCRLPLSDPAASAHYRGMPPRQAFAVFEYDANAGVGAAGDRSAWSRLRPVDAGRTFAALRGKYADQRRYLVAPATVRLLYAARRDPTTRKELPGAYLRGEVADLVVGLVSVPPDLRPLFAGLGRTTREYLDQPESKSRGPRYAVTLFYGKRYEPWVASARLLPAAAPKP
jgi:hypothetical protein